MPKNLTSTGTSFPAQTTPLAGEPRTGGSIETPFQNAADRSQFLYDRLIYIDPDKGGARRVRRFASIAAMKTSTDHDDRTIAAVDGFGLYQYIATSDVVEASPIVVAPTDVGAGFGRWVHSSYGALNVANGVPQLNASARVPTERLEASAGAAKIDAANVTRGIIDARVLRTPAAETSISSSAFTDVIGATATITLVAGDIIYAHFVAGTEAMTPSQEGEFQVAVEQPSTAVISITNVPSPKNTTDFQSVSIIGSGVALESGLHTIKLQARRASGAGTVIVRAPTGYIQIVRP